MEKRRVALTSFGHSAPSTATASSPQFGASMPGEKSEGMITSALMMEKLYRKYAVGDPNYGKIAELDEQLATRQKAMKEKVTQKHKEIEREMASAPKKKKQKKSCDCKVTCSANQSTIKAHCRGKAANKK